MTRQRSNIARARQGLSRYSCRRAGDTGKISVNKLSSVTEENVEIVLLESDQKKIINVTVNNGMTIIDDLSFFTLQ